MGDVNHNPCTSLYAGFQCNLDEHTRQVPHEFTKPYEHSTSFTYHKDSELEVIGYHGENYYPMEVAIKLFLKNILDPNVDTYFQFHERAQHESEQDRESTDNGNQSDDLRSHGQALH